MNQANETAVRKIIAEQFQQDIETINNDDVLAKNYGAKSQDIIQLSAVIQGKFKIKIPYMESRTCKTVGDWIKLVDKKVNEN